ncbi:Regulatory protein msrR [Tsukamurella paurometabola]|uniref:Regulatory protein msrR n=1 Tax=Tsukamurella paurometabola TaxID=2061 RepID=A0A3P8MBQ9_TSUPA|nr:Regulatory protein msrR [Tsukamurella paurometabola]
MCVNDERPRDERNLAWSQVPEGDPRSRAPRHPQGIPRPRPGQRPGPPQPQQRAAQQPPRRPGPPQGAPQPGPAQPRATRVERPQPQPRQEWAPRQEPEPLPASEVKRPVGARGSSGGRVPPPPRPPRKPRGRDRDPGRRSAVAPAPAAPAPKKVRRKRKLHPFRWLGVFLVLLLVGTVAGTIYFDGKLTRIDALASYAGRVADTPGTNWLLVGTDAREGLTPEQQKALATGGDLGGARTDTIMLVHIPKSGAATLVSIPRDLYVQIPGQGGHKINAAYFLGSTSGNGDAAGAQLLVQTFEKASGVRIDHYAEIGFGGFANMVDAIGGVEMCPKYPINDPKAGLRIKAGCQTLDGAQALGYVRTRATPNADLDRVVHQREFMSALFKEATSPTTLLNPFEMWGLSNAVVEALSVDKDTHLWDLARLAWAMSGDTVTTTTPTAGSEYTSDGDSLAWGKNTDEFFGLLAADQPVPARLLSGTPGTG